MNKKLMVAALLSLVSYSVANASSEFDEEAELKKLMGSYYDFTVTTTPVKTKKVTSELSPTSRRFISESQKAEQEFESARAELEATKQQLSERDERIAQLEMQISESLSTIADLVNKNQELQGKVTDKDVALQRLKDMLRRLHEQLNIWDKQVADFETTTELDD